MTWNLETIATILFFALTLLGTLWGGLTLAIKKLGALGQKGADISKEVGEAMTALAQTAADGVFTKEEILQVLDEFDDIPGAIAGLKAIKKVKENGNAGKK